MGHSHESTTTTTTLPRYLLSQNPNNKTGTWSSKAAATHTPIVHTDEVDESPTGSGISAHDGGWGERQGRCGGEAADDDEGEGVAAGVLLWGDGGLCGGV